MAKFKEINFLLKLQPGQFSRATAQAQAEYNKTKSKVEKDPINMKGNIQNLLNGFAQVGLALNGLKASYNLIAGPAKQLVNLSNIQEQADIRLIATLKSLNLYTEENYKLLKTQASTIQNLTVVGDEQAEKLQALALSMGIAFDKIDEVTRGSIGLSTSFAAAGLSQETAMKGLALAYQGNFTQLQRYIPALQAAESTTEKMALVQDAMAKGFKVANEETNSGYGSMKQFQNIVGDVKEDLGDFVKAGLIPIIKTIQPLLAGFTEMEEGTQQASLATLGFLVVGTRVPGMLVAIRTGVIALNASLGPVGWLVLGIGAAATAWGIYASAGDDASASNEKIAASNEKVNKSFIPLLEKLQKATQLLTLEDLRRKQKASADSISESISVLNNLYDDLKKAEAGSEKERLKKLISDNERILELRRKENDGLEKVLIERRRRLFQIETGMTEDELNELDKRRDYEFESQRISLANYIQYLNLRRDQLKESLGEESVEYLKFLDKLAELQDKLGNSKIQAKPVDTNKLTPTETSPAESPYIELQSVATDYYEFIHENIDAEYIHRKTILELEQENIRILYGERSTQYAAILARQLENDKNYAQAKATLQKEAAVHAIDLSSKLMDAFQGQSRALFSVGKAASIAQATINTYEGATKALSKYPPPFSYVAAAAQIAFGLAQVSKIVKTDYKTKREKIAGLAQGGLITPDMLFGSAATPKGEDGIIGAKKFEFVMPQRPAMRYLPILEAMRQERYPAIPGFANGGVVGGGNRSQSVPDNIINPNLFTAMEDAVVRGFARSKLKIEGEEMISGRNIKRVYDKEIELRERL